MTRSTASTWEACMTRAAYSARLWFSWIHLLVVAVYVAALCAEGGSMQIIERSAGEWARQWAHRGKCLRMAEVYLAALGPAFAAGIFAPEQGAGAAELAATHPGGLARLFSERLLVVAVALAVPAVATVTWAVRMSHGALGALELAMYIVPTMLFLTGVASLGAMAGGVLAGFSAGFGWWALDGLTGGTVTGPLFVFGATFGLHRARVPQWLTLGRQKLLLLAVGTVMLLACRLIAETQAAWGPKRE